MQKWNRSWPSQTAHATKSPCHQATKPQNPIKQERVSECVCVCWFWGNQSLSFALVSHFNHFEINHLSQHMDFWHSSGAITHPWVFVWLKSPNSISELSSAQLCVAGNDSSCVVREEAGHMSLDVRKTTWGIRGSDGSTGMAGQATKSPRPGDKWGVSK